MATMTIRVGSVLLVVGCCATACGANDDTPAKGVAGSPGSTNPPAGTTSGVATSGDGTGGATSGGMAIGGAATSGAATSGEETGGAATSGAATSGAATSGDGTGGATSGSVAIGGAATSGAATSGVATSGEGTGGTATGGVATGGAVTGGGGGATCPSGGWTAGDQTITWAYDGIERTYDVHVPPDYTGTTAVPLMLVLPGAHNTPGMIRSWSQMNSVADENGFIVVYPASIDCWNAGWTIGAECPAADDDVGFLRAVVSDIESNACVDAKRVYVTGLSIGSVMAQYMGCHAADIFAAVGGVAGGMGGDCSPSRPISVFYVHGTLDGDISSAESNATRWADRNGCDSTPVEVYSQGSTTCTAYRGCDEGVEVEFCPVTGMGHCWPEDTSCLGTGNGVTDFKASPMMWEFFARHSLP